MDADSQQQWLRDIREQLSTMDENSLQRLRPDLLHEAISSMDRAKEESSVALASAVFQSVSVLLTTIRVRFLFDDPGSASNQNPVPNETGYAKLGMICASACRILEQGVRGKEEDELSPPVYNAIEDLMR